MVIKMPNPLFKFSSGLYLVATKEGSRLNGCIINMVMQVSNAPEKVTVTISKNNLTHDMILASHVFTLSVLSEEVPPIVFGQFGFQSGRNIDKFSGFPHKLDENGLPYLEEGMTATLAARVVETVDVGTHTIFIAEVTGGQDFGGESMTYAYYHKFRKGVTPKNAPNYTPPPGAADK